VLRVAICFWKSQSPDHLTHLLKIRLFHLNGYKPITYTGCGPARCPVLACPTRAPRRHLRHIPYSTRTLHRGVSRRIGVSSHELPHSHSAVRIRPCQALERTVVTRRTAFDQTRACRAYPSVGNIAQYSLCLVAWPCITTGKRGKVQLELEMVVCIPIFGT
jgi:hypothetical protein